MVLLVITLRLIFPLLMLRFPLVGWIVSFIGDNIDLVLLEASHSPYLQHYQQLDKLLDLFFLTILAVLVMQWKESLLRSLALVMYGLRFVGVLVFIVTGKESSLLYFPDLLPIFFLIVLLDNKFFKSTVLSTKRNVVMITLLLLICKLIFEYILHVYIPLQR